MEKSFWKRITCTHCRCCATTSRSEVNEVRNISTSDSGAGSVILASTKEWLGSVEKQPMSLIACKSELPLAISTWKYFAFAGSNLMATAKQLNTERSKSRMEDKLRTCSDFSLKFKHWSSERSMERSELNPPHFLKVARHLKFSVSKIQKIN